MRKEDFDVLCILGERGEDWQQAYAWLDEQPKRRLVWIFFQETAGFHTAQAHPRVKCRMLDSPLQIDAFAKQIAWESVLLKLKILGGETGLAAHLKQKIQIAHITANLLLSDASDFGVSVMKNSFAQRNRRVRDGMKLSGAFSKKTAIVVGAGPSLTKNKELLETFQHSALILAGGSALNLLNVEPHFAASIDKEAPYRQFKQYPFWETPFCFQNRMNKENFSLIHGEAILFPDSHFSFLNEADSFNAGWTVGTFLISLATFLGCDPIVLVGMDLCYEGGQKYANMQMPSQEGLVETIAQDGRAVLTQADWLMAREWIEEWALSHSDRTFINATEGGIGFSSPIQTASLSELSFEKAGDLKKLIHETIQQLPFAAGFRWDVWKKSLENCIQLVDTALMGGEVDALESEIGYERLLLPVWRIWSPLFERELEFDSYEGKLNVNKFLFFKQVLQEHLYAIE